MKYEKKDSGFIDDSCLVQVVQMNHMYEVMYLQKRNTKMPITVVGNKHYYFNSDPTQELYEFNHTTNRSEGYESLRRTFKALRYYINYNFKGKSNELHVTLTYADNMTDPRQLEKNFKSFILAIRRKYGSVECINVVEPQERGAWHCHVLMRFDDLTKIYIPNDEMRKYWKHGFVTIKSLKDVDNIGAYLSAYLTDVELTNETIKDLKDGDLVQTKVVDGQEKKFIKGGRLHMYPVGMKIYRTSKGIEKPSKEFMQFGEFKKVVGNSTPHYSQSITIKDDNDNNINNIVYHQYNLKRQNLQDGEGKKI